jgi:tyrosine-protein phosphatase non-receptor type 9
VCFDDTRIKLKSKGSAIDSSDYIHANYVDGYKQKNAYISTQGPLDHTIEDFWRMVWQENCVVIVMTTRVREQRKIKCAQYWPQDEDTVLDVSEEFQVKNMGVDLSKDEYLVLRLEIKHVPTGRTRQIAHCQYTGWPDHGVPKSASDMLEFLHVVRHNQMNYTEKLNAKWYGHPLGPPIVVHCSAGIGRTGTFCTTDISINRFLDTKRIDIYNTVLKIRSQRASSVQMPDQYVFCYMAMVEYAIQENLLSGQVDLNELFSKDS